MKYYASAFVEEFRKDVLQKAFGKVKSEKPASSRKGTVSSACRLLVRLTSL